MGCSGGDAISGSASSLSERASHGASANCPDGAATRTPTAGPKPERAASVAACLLTPLASADSAVDRCYQWITVRLTRAARLTAVTTPSSCISYAPT